MKASRWSKEAFRKELLQIRAQIPFQRREEAQKHLQENLFSLPSLPLLSFYSFGTEISTQSINALFQKKGLLVLPKIVGEDLHFYFVENSSQLVQGDYPFLEPHPSLCSPFLWDQKCILLVPGLGFDRNLYRIGYGKGFYDRLLAKYPKTLALGIGFKEQQVEDLPLTSHDYPLASLHLF